VIEAGTEGFALGNMVAQHPKAEAHYEARSWTSWHHHMSLVAPGPSLRHVGPPTAQKKSANPGPGDCVAASRLALPGTHPGQGSGNPRLPPAPQPPRRC
jgi:hypothetical protein